LGEGLAEVLAGLASVAPQEDEVRVRLPDGVPEHGGELHVGHVVADVLRRIRVIEVEGRCLSDGARLAGSREERSVGLQGLVLTVCGGIARTPESSGSFSSAKKRGSLDALMNTSGCCPR
jgi:hypothetical protein